jgi:hypothetical protein
MQNYLYLTLALLFIATTYQIKPDFFTSLSNFVHDKFVYGINQFTFNFSNFLFKNKLSK